MSQLLTPASAADRAALRDITARVEALKGDAAAVLYELGSLLRQVEEESLWRAGDYTSFTDYLERGVDVSRTTARRCIDIARHFGLDVAQRYGFDKLARGLRYAALTAKEEQPGDLIAARLRLRGADGRFETVSFHEATGRQVEDAIQLELERRASLRPVAPEGVGDRVERLSASLPPPPRGLRPAHQRVEACRTRTGEVSLTFRQIPLSELRAFVDALERELMEG